MQDWLKVYADMEWQVLPCSNKDKAPITAHGFKDATCDWRQIQEWHRQNPGCAWAVVTSAERGVIDIDPRNDGDKTLAALIAEHGALPDTPKVKTGGGGFHYWFRFPAGTPCGKPFPGIDRKAEGGYVIVPPSRISIPEHEGRAYAWEKKPWEVEIADAPAWLLGAKPKVKASAQADAEAENPWVVQAASLDLLSHPGSPEGERNYICPRLIGVHFARGDSESSIMAMAEAWASRCQPPLEESEWRKHFNGVAAKEARALKMTTPSAPTVVSVAIGEDRADTLLPEAGKEVSKPPLPSAKAQGEILTYLLPAGDGRAQADLLTSFPSPGEAEPDGGSSELSSSFPTLPPEAYHGLLGDMLKAVEPETEADPSGVLLGWLTCFGSCVGRGAWMTVGARRHHPALYVGIVGRTSDAKGDTWAVSVFPFKQIEAAWASACIANGVGSGEGLIERVADAQTVIGKDGSAEVIPGALDKRCLLRLSELSRCFKVGRRENATLSESLREAWDGEPISIPNRKGNALGTSDYAISMVGDITPGMVRRLMDGGTEAFDGWANRYLWACVRSPRSLPMGGNIAVLTPYLSRLQSALAFAKSVGEVKMQADAERLWREVYPSLKASGDSVPHTDRARPYALRLAMLYALADGSSVIRLDHLQAALALWSYCRASAKLIFGSQQTAEAKPDELWLRLLNAIAASPGVKRCDLTTAFKNKAKADELDKALDCLERSGLAFKQTVQGPGRPAECWFPMLGPDGEGKSVADDNPAFFPPEAASPFPSANASKEVSKSADAGLEADAGNASKEVSKSEADGDTYLLTSQAPEQEPGDTYLLTSLPGSEPQGEGEGEGQGDDNFSSLSQMYEIPNKEEVVKQNPPAASPKPSAPVHVTIADITPSPNAPLEAEADEALGDDDFLGDFIKAKRKAKEDEEWDATWTG